MSGGRRGSHCPEEILHSAELRGNVVEYLRRVWPSDATSWDEVLIRLSRTPRLDLPPAPLIRSLGNSRPLRFDADDLARPIAQLRAIIKPHVRPALFVRGRDFDKASMDYWNQRLEPAKSRLADALSAVGRVEFVGHDLLAWDGTAWLVRPNIVVTNAHVAKLFAMSDGSGWAFQKNASNTPIGALVDYRREHESVASEPVRVRRILHVQESGNPDLAFLEVEPSAGRDRGIELADAVASDTEVVTIGYPKFDSSVLDPEDLERVFDGVYNVKRLSPGQVTDVRPRVFEHDCSTLGGSSGSAVVEIDTGRAVGLHFGGNYDANVAVPAAEIRQMLDSLRL